MVEKSKPRKAGEAPGLPFVLAETLDTLEV